MKVNELIARLQKLERQDIEVLVNVRVHARVSGVAQVTPWEVDDNYGGATIEITLPAGMFVSRRKRR